YQQTQQRKVDAGQARRQQALDYRGLALLERTQKHLHQHERLDRFAFYIRQGQGGIQQGERLLAQAPSVELQAQLDPGFQGLGFVEIDLFDQVRGKARGGGGSRAGRCRRRCRRGGGVCARRARARHGRGGRSGSRSRGGRGGGRRRRGCRGL